MYSRGEYSDKKDTYGVILKHTKHECEILLIQSGQVCSAFKRDATESYSFISNKAKEVYEIIHTGLAGCTSKNGVSTQFALGTSVIHQFIKAKIDFAIELFNGEITGIEADCDEKRLKTSYIENGQDYMPVNIPYIKLTKQFNSNKSKDSGIELSDEDSLDSVPVRSVAEIALEKEDISWLKQKKYYIVNDDAQAEKIFQFLDNYSGAIGYDTETTGLRINCFGKIGSSYKRQLEKYNEEHPNDKIRADRLVGIIFCVEPNISYYFPCFNRKFKNLYQEDSVERRRIINNIKARYTVGEFHDKQSEMAEFIRNTPSEEWGSDVILMERVRDILSTKHMVTHGGSFEWKVGWQYEIDTNITDDTMIMHQIMYKFRSTTSNRGEPSNLKYLSKVELGIDQWELNDFFPDFEEDVGEIKTRAGGRKKKKSSKIDFSYMDYDGTRVYAPTDGDATLLLFLKYKRDLMENHREQEYIYNVEVIVSCAIAYMEFYGLRIDEDKIAAVRDQSKAKLVKIESEIRQSVGYSREDEIEAYNKLKEAVDEFNRADKDGTKAEREEANQKTLNAVEELNKAIASNEEHILNLASPSQVAELFYDTLQIPFSGEKKSVAKKEVKGLLKAKNDDGSPKYPVVHMYSEYKKIDTLLTKFFDNLPNFMYPGGLVFANFGQISTATGRMSCNKPNLQQMPKDITKIIVPRPGNVIIDADFSQIEYRVLTALAGNDWLARLFEDPDSDYHTLMASLMYGVDYASVTPSMRSDAKSFNFGIPYGMGIGSLAILLKGVNNPTTRAEAMEKYEKYFENQPKTRKFFDQVKEMAQVNKYTKTFWNRYRYYSFTDAEGNENNARKAAALRQAGNAVIQGCLHGDTLIDTKEHGIVRIQDVVNEHLNVWDGDKWSQGDVLYSGKKRKCVITFNNNQKFICNPIHKFSVVDYDKDISEVSNGKRFVECKDLKPGVMVECNTMSRLRVSTNVTNVPGVNTSLYAIEVASVEITDEYIDMYDVCNTDEGYYVADGLITHNTAADIFKISVARNFMYIRENKLFGDFLIINMIHDEQLMEVNVQSLNVQRILRDIGINMQFKIEGFPPLYIGAGVGKAWGEAKGKMAEIHPVLLEKLSREADNIPIRRSNTEKVDINEVYKYFSSRVLDFRREKVKNYLMDSKNWGKDLHPAIGNLINLQFTYGHDKEKEGLSDGEFTLLCIDEFIKHEGIQGVDSSKFVAQKQQADADSEEDKEYSDDDLEESEDDEYDDSDFALIDESNKIYGSSVHDLIRIFGCFVSQSKGICGVDLNRLNYKKKEMLIEFLANHSCEPTDVGAMEIVFLQEANTLNRTGIFVNNINGSEIAARIANTEA